MRSRLLLEFTHFEQEHYSILKDIFEQLGFRIFQTCILLLWMRMKKQESSNACLNSCWSLELNAAYDNLLHTTKLYSGTNWSARNSFTILQPLLFLYNLYYPTQTALENKQLEAYAKYQMIMATEWMHDCNWFWTVLVKARRRCEKVSFNVGERTRSLLEKREWHQKHTQKTDNGTKRSLCTSAWMLSYSYESWRRRTAKYDTP